ncbi:MAG: hypothetical protein MK086_14930, partial [Flavobacteriales bacterium]|nr:hypothetical protein [Flavobacteriales bacterium]
EVVRNEIDGLILEKNDLTSLTNSMERLLQNREELEKFSSAAFEGRDRFSRKHFISDQLTILKRYEIN